MSGVEHTWGRSALALPGVETWRSSLPRHNNCSESKVQTAFNAFNKCNYVWQPTLSCRSTFLSQNERKWMQHFGLECVSCHVWCEPNSCARARATRCHSVTHERYGCTTLVALLDLPVGVSDSTEDNVYTRITDIQKTRRGVVWNLMSGVGVILTGRGNCYLSSLGCP